MSLPPPPPKPFTPPKRRQSAVGDAPPSFVPTNPGVEGSAGVSGNESNSASEENASGLWQSRVDPASGNTYYFHTVTEETTWVNPYEDETKLAVSAVPVLELVMPVEPEDDDRPATPPAAHSSFQEPVEVAIAPPLPHVPPVPSKTSSDPLPPAYSFTSSSPPMAPSAISFMDVQVKYRFTSARRLVTIQLDELKLTQQVTATKMKENLCSEVDLDSFERPKGPLDGLVTFKLTTATVDDSEEPEPEPSPAPSSPQPPRPSLLHSSSIGPSATAAVSAKFTQGASFLKGLRSQSTKFNVTAAPAADGGENMYTRTKQFQFKSAEEADSFISCIRLAKNYGEGLRTAFQMLDSKRRGFINVKDIMEKVPKINAEDADKMISLGDMTESGTIDFASFFSVFLDKCATGDETLSNDEKDDPKDVLERTIDRWLSLSNESADLSHSNPMARQQASRARAESAVIVGAWASMMLPGEDLIKTMERVRWRGESMGDRELLGSLRVTSYRLIFSRYPPMKVARKAARRTSLTEQSTTSLSDDVPAYFQLISLPLTTIYKLEFAQRLGSQPEVKIQCKDMRLVRVGLEGGRAAVDQLIATLRTVAFPGAGPMSCFAFRYKPHAEDTTTGSYPNRWDLFNPEKEFTRIGFLDNGDWRIFKQDFSAQRTEIDPSFGKTDEGSFLLAPTYPEYLILPKAMTDEQIVGAAQYRSKQRLPSATWMDRRTGAVLARSSQTMAGLGGKKNQEDINLLEHIRVLNNRSGEASRPLYIADCRGRVAATGNKLQGKGAENVSNYTNAHLCFCDILNIHTMRDSQNGFAKLLYPEVAVTDVSQADPAAATNILPPAVSGEPYFLRKLEDCGWLRHVSLVLSASVWTAHKLREQGASVLVHCSDGWDRTAQVCGLAQMLLDPFYRTIEGFGILVEKEWLAFGHKFHERTGHSVDETHQPNERSPIFIQWMECIAHVIKQFPSAFQFNELFVIFVADHLHSCLFGNFLGDTDLERKITLKVKEDTTSLWSYALHHSKRFTNPSYVNFDGPIWPNVGIRDVSIWRRYYLRHTPEAHPNKFTGVKWEDDLGSPNPVLEGVQ